MNIQSINSMTKALEQSNVQTAAESKGNTPFKSFFNSAMDNLSETNTMVKTADKMSIDFALGNIDNVADVMIAQEKASVALQYTVQVRNKLLDAYNEIMRMQV